MTPDQAAQFLRWMMLMALLGGFLGAMAWDVIKVEIARVIAFLANALARRQRIKAARARGTAPVDQILVCRGKYAEHDWEPSAEAGRVVSCACSQCGQEVDFASP